MYPDNKCWIKAIINHHWRFTNTINITSYCWVSIFKPGGANKRPKCYLLHCEAEAVFTHLPRDVLHKSLLLSATNIDISTEQGRNSVHTEPRRTCHMRISPLVVQTFQIFPTIICKCFNWGSILLVGLGIFPQNVLPEENMAGVIVVVVSSLLHLFHTTSPIPIASYYLSLLSLFNLILLSL